ncbi:hypothetical protein [Chamaesiphon polymorphus]|nr:hypothetical protein [Chamaesiphon polymorphus]
MLLSQQNTPVGFPRWSFTVLDLDVLLLQLANYAIEKDASVWLELVDRD